MLSTTVLSSTGLPKMLLTGRIYGPAQLFADWQLVLRFTFISFDTYNFFTKKPVFVKLVDASFLH